MLTLLVVLCGTNAAVGYINMPARSSDRDAAAAETLVLVMVAKEGSRMRTACKSAHGDVMTCWVFELLKKERRENKREQLGGGKEK